MNQISRQKATSPVKRDFYKLLNNANFGIDCRNNIDNCHFKPVYDEIGETAYIKKFDSIFDNGKYRDFPDINLMREEVNEKYKQLILAVNKNDPTYKARKYSLEGRRDVHLDSIKSTSAHRKRIGKNNFL